MEKTQNARVDVYTAATLRGLQALIIGQAQDSSRAGFVPRSISHAVDDAAPEAERYSAIVLYGRITISDAQVVSDEAIAAALKSVSATE